MGFIGRREYFFGCTKHPFGKNRKEKLKRIKKHVLLDKTKRDYNTIVFHHFKYKLVTKIVLTGDNRDFIDIRFTFMFFFSQCVIRMKEASSFGGSARHLAFIFSR